MVRNVYLFSFVSILVALLGSCDLFGVWSDGPSDSGSDSTADSSPEEPQPEPVQSPNARSTGTGTSVEVEWQDPVSAFASIRISLSPGGPTVVVAPGVERRIIDGLTLNQAYTVSVVTVSDAQVASDAVTTSVTPTALCGDGVVSTVGGEVCDGANLGGATCTSLSLGYTGGTLVCASDCTLDVSACTSP